LVVVVAVVVAVVAVVVVVVVVVVVAVVVIVSQHSLLFSVGPTQISMEAHPSYHAGHCSHVSSNSSSRRRRRNGIGRARMSKW